MFTVNEQRLRWVKDIWNIDLHDGQKKALLAKRQHPPHKGIRVEHHDRRWGKSFLLKIEICTYFLAFPHKTQGILSFSGRRNQELIVQVAKLLATAAANPQVVEMFPHLSNLKFYNDEIGLEIDGKYTSRIFIPKLGLFVDRLFVDEFNHIALEDFLKAVRSLSEKGELYFLGGGARVTTENPGIDPKDVELANSSMPDD